MAHLQQANGQCTETWGQRVYVCALFTWWFLHCFSVRQPVFYYECAVSAVYCIFVSCSCTISTENQLQAYSARAAHTVWWFLSLHTCALPIMYPFLVLYICVLPSMYPFLVLYLCAFLACTHVLLHTCLSFHVPISGLLYMNGTIYVLFLGCIISHLSYVHWVLVCYRVQVSSELS